MKSAWFWGTSMWADYLKEYATVRPECLTEFKSSPLANDHDFCDVQYDDPMADQWQLDTCQTQVIDLAGWSWGEVRKSYRPIIKKAQREHDIAEYNAASFVAYKDVHILANGGQPRPDMTYEYQRQWLTDGYGLLVGAMDAFAYWIVYQGAAYYMSGPSVEKNVQHAVVWKSLEVLKAKGIKFVDMGQIDGPGMTEKEINVGKFKRGFGGEARPFLMARKI